MSAFGGLPGSAATGNLAEQGQTGADYFPGLLGAWTLLGAPGITTRSKDATNGLLAVLLGAWTLLGAMILFDIFYTQCVPTIAA